MAEPTADNLSAVWQAMAAVGVFVGGVIAALIGARKKSDPADDAATLRAKLGMELLRRDLEQVFAAHREAMETRFRMFEASIHEKIDGLSEERRSVVNTLDERLRELEMGRRQR